MKKNNILKKSKYSIVFEGKKLKYPPKLRVKTQSYIF
jgi:hypothetical protein